MSVTPAVGLYDQARMIVISHLATGWLVSVTATSRRSDGVWSASATFKAAGGLVDLARDAPVSGSYRGVSPMGLFWSQHRVDPGSASPGVTPTTIAVSAGSHRLVSGSVTQLLSGPGVTEHVERVAAAGFYGEYFAPPGSGRRPAVVVWGGSEGGLSESPSMAALLASHGIPALALAYFDEPGLPCSLSNIPLEYFARAIRWLGSQPEVDRGRVWAMSGSRGSEAALLVASRWPGLVHGVVVSAPSSEVYGSIGGRCSPAAPAAWTLAGTPLPDAHVAFADVVYHADASVSEAPAFRAGLDDVASARAAQIPVQRIKGPVLLISGGEDQLWPSDTYANRIMSGLRRDPAPHLHLNFPSAGHAVFGIPYQPSFTQATVARGIVIDLGGTSVADSAAHQRDWPAAIKFVSTH